MINRVPAAWGEAVGKAEAHSKRRRGEIGRYKRTASLHLGHRSRYTSSSDALAPHQRTHLIAKNRQENYKKKPIQLCAMAPRSYTGFLLNTDKGRAKNFFILHPLEVETLNTNGKPLVLSVSKPGTRFSHSQRVHRKFLFAFPLSFSYLR
jgi:hypothetical protein